MNFRPEEFGFGKTVNFGNILETYPLEPCLIQDNTWEARDRETQPILLGIEKIRIHRQRVTHFEKHRRVQWFDS